MKQIVMVLWMLLLPNLGYTQNNHLIFNGIPIDGPISRFEQRLAMKGFKPRYDVNKNLPIGERSYKGNYMGYAVDFISVYFSPKTKKVYRVEVVIGSEGDAYINRIFNEFIDRSKIRYADNALSVMSNDLSDEFVLYIHSISNRDLFGWDNCIGNIKAKTQMYWRQPTSAGHQFNQEKASKYYIVKITFTDKVNERINEMEIREDL